jgi:hypothetical protein
MRSYRQGNVNTKVLTMPQKNIIELIESRCAELGWTKKKFVQQFGYANYSKAERRLDGLRSGNWESAKGLLEKLSTVLGVTKEEVHAAVKQRKFEIAEYRLEQQRAAFAPKAFIITNPDRPRQITMCAMLHGTRHREIDLANISEKDYFPHAFRELHNEDRMEKLRWFFDNPIGIRINYSFDLSKTFDLLGNFISTADHAIEQGVATVSIA